MKPFETLHGRAVILLKDNVDTDQIIPGKELMKTTKTGFGDGLFAEWRYAHGRVENPSFVLNQPQAKLATVLITGRNFGCGSSREAAAWAIRDYGFRCVVAMSFSPIFYSNCVKNGLLPTALADRAHSDLITGLEESDGMLTVDLEACTIALPGGRSWPFSLPALHRQMLLGGLDAISYAQTFLPQTEEFRAKDRLRRPWVYLDASRS